MLKMILDKKSDKYNFKPKVESLIQEEIKN